MNKKNILIIGSGGREHAIAWALAKSDKVGRIYCAPGNAGMTDAFEKMSNSDCCAKTGMTDAFEKMSNSDCCAKTGMTDAFEKMSNSDCCAKARMTDAFAKKEFGFKCVDISVDDHMSILAFVNAHPDIYMTVVAPDNPLADGLVDKLEAAGHRAFGPRANAARLEASKSFAKYIMQKYGIPTARFAEFTDYLKAEKYLEACDYPIVLKADGLALGKGVLICENKSDALVGLKKIMLDKEFGTAGDKLIIEEFLRGFECSALAFTDGVTVLSMTTSQDHKRALDGDRGENTGGMGTFSPSYRVTRAMEKRIYDEVLLPTVLGLKAEGIKFKGVLYAGLMIDGDNIKVLEFNARFGDPETQVILPRLKNDLFDIFEAVIDGTLDKIKLEFTSDAAVCIVAASGGYPAAYEKGKEITCGKLDDNVTVFYAGAASKNGKLVTNGGRVLGVTALAPTLKLARDLAYKNIKQISFDSIHYRTDILKELK